MNIIYAGFKRKPDASPLYTKDPKNGPQHFPTEPFRHQVSLGDTVQLNYSNFTCLTRGTSLKYRVKYIQVTYNSKYSVACYFILRILYTLTTK